MRQIDRWVGVPVCFLLTICRRFGDFWRLVRKPKPGGIYKILFVKLAEQGATVLAYPAIRRAVETVGRENVYFLLFAENRFILDVMDVVPRENVITIPTRGIWSVFVGALRSLRQLRRLRADAAIDWEFFARGSATLAYLSGAPIRVGLHACRDGAPYRGRLMTHELRYDPNEHTADLYVRMVNAINECAETVGPVCRTGPEAPTSQPAAGPARQAGPTAEGDEFPVFMPTTEELAEVRLGVQREAQTSECSPLVLLNANASDLLPLRRWPSERYVELARRLLDGGSDIHIAFTGAPDEADVAAELVQAVGSDRCFSMAGKTTLRDLLVLYCLADVLVTNDSGPAHFAALTPIHVVTLFGPETPARFASRSPRSHILWKGIPCSPCVDAYNNRLSTCRNNECMQQITVDEALGAVADSLGSQTGRSS